MNSTTFSNKKWIAVVIEALEHTDGSASAVADWLRGQRAELATECALGDAVIAGIGELLLYADNQQVGATSVLDEETQAIEASRKIVRPVFQAKLQMQLSNLDAQSKGLGTPCPECGNPAESQGLRSRSWTSLLGDVSLKRRYVFCGKCKQGVALAQTTLGLPDEQFTPRLEEVCTMMATTVPYGMAKDLVGKVCGLDISEKAIEDMTDRRGKVLTDNDTRQAILCNPFEDSGLPVEHQHLPAVLAAKDTTLNIAPKIAYVEIDGVIPITREQLTGKELSPADKRRQTRAKKDKARGGKGRRYRIVGREVKNAVLYDGKDCASAIPSRGSILEKTYVSHLGDWMSFALRLWVAMLRLRFHTAKRVIILSDGAEWIRSLAEWLPIKTLLILDLYHVSHRIWEVANALYGDKTPAGAKWARTQFERVENGKVTDVLRALRFIKPRRQKTRDLVDKLVGYLKDNRDRMHYPEYKSQGFRITSAAVESANFHVTGTRLKLQGMRWSANGAKQMAALRADLFNGRWEARTRELLAA